MHGFSLPAVKAALHRGRAHLRELAEEPDDRAAAGTVGGRSRPPRRLCRAFQCAGLRRHPRHDRRRCPARARQPDAPERQGRGVPIFRKLFEGQRLAPGAGTGGRPPAILVFDPASRRCGRNISCCCNGPPTRSAEPSATSATRPTSSMAPNTGSDGRRRRRTAFGGTIILAIAIRYELWCMVALHWAEGSKAEPPVRACCGPEISRTKHVKPKSGTASGSAAPNGAVDSTGDTVR